MARPAANRSVLIGCQLNHETSKRGSSVSEIPVSSRKSEKKNSIFPANLTRLPPDLFGARPAITLLRLLIILAAVFVLFRIIFMPVRVTGISMSPTYEDGDMNFIRRTAYRASDPRRGDVVALRIEGELLLKRIIALPGESIGITNGVVFVGGSPLPEPYVKRRHPEWFVATTGLADDQYVVIGDNRGMPQYQHAFGLARREEILGRVLF
jgi:signal peptidase I